MLVVVIAFHLALRVAVGRFDFSGVGLGYALSLSLGVLAWVSGYFSGLSRESATAELVSVVFGLVGTLAGFLSIRIEKTQAIGMSIIVVSASLFFGISRGAELRFQHESRDGMIGRLEDMKAVARRERDIKAYREALGLEWPPPER